LKRLLALAAGVAALYWFGLQPDPASALTWCGGAPPAADVLPDAVGGDQIHVVYHVVYAVPSDGPDRFAQLGGAIAADVDEVTRWWRSHDPTRTPRFDLLRPDCLDIASVRLAQPASAFVAAAPRYGQITSELQVVLSHPRKKGLIFYDSPLPLETDLCGYSAISPTEGGARASAAVFLAPNLNVWPGCGFLGVGHYTAVIAAHELVHSLGALIAGAPHACPADPAHPCDSITDVLVARGGDCCLSGRLLDFGRNDYYAHGGAWWDIRNSTWLSHLEAPPQQLTVRIAGDADNSVVTSAVPGISCPPGCTVPFDGDQTVTLVGEWAEGRELRRWEGDCTGAGACSVVMTSPRTVTAVVARIRYDLKVRVRGNGRVTSSPRGLVACPRKCRASFSYGTVVRLSAHAARGAKFVGWSGECFGRGRCAVDGDATVTATFRR
jgi:hypothetical protein